MSQPPPSPGPSSALERLKGSDPGRWPHMAAAEALSRSKMALLLKAAGHLPQTDEGALVAFGSLARGEFTEGSDLDWAFIVDGRADSDHLGIALTLEDRIRKEGFGEPGPTGVFGGLVFSHELIHAIGGEEDTNRNTTRRLLLLLESKPVDARGSVQAHDRLISGILKRYVEEDASFIASNRRSDRIPRFLLNDVVRFWRTMAVDYANKYRARSGRKWALRNIKLRMSRKLLFASGIFMCLSWALSRHDDDDDLLIPKLVGHLRDWTRRPPLESLALVVERHGRGLADDIFDSYDAFLGLLGDRAFREELEGLKPEEAYQSRTFIDARKIAYTFDEALTALLFRSDDDVTRLVQKYGVF